MENLSRRSFLALGTLGAASAAAAGLAGCAPQTKGSASTDLATTGNRSSEPINSSGIEVNPDEVVEVIETNIVIVGGGLSGLAAAVQAAENGDDFILLEAQATLGGNGQGVEGTFAVDSRFQKEQNIQVDRSIIMQEELGKTQWVADGLLYKDLCDNWRQTSNGSSINAVASWKAPSTTTPSALSVGSVDTFHSVRRTARPTMWATGCPCSRSCAMRRRTSVSTTAPWKFSYDENGAINGVYAIDAFGDLVQYQAKAVIVATGGFADPIDRRMTKWGFDPTPPSSTSARRATSATAST